MKQLKRWREPRWLVRAGLAARSVLRVAKRLLQRLAKLPPLHLAIVLSVLLHAALLIEWQFRKPVDKDLESKWGDTPGKFTVQLAPLPATPAPPPSPPAPAAEKTPPPEPAKSAPTPKPAPKPAPKPPPTPAAKPETATSPPVIARNQPAPTTANTAPSTPATPAASAAAPPQSDFSAQLEARRRARESQQSTPAATSTAPAEDDIARRDKIVAANLGAKTEAFGFDPRNGGGVFQIVSLNDDYSEFKFYGWRNDIRRRAAQVFEVRKGNHADIRLAVVRQMIAIIREHESAKFVWQSQRLGQALSLSAAPADNAGLEAFFLQEFFVGGQIRRYN